MNEFQAKIIAQLDTTKIGSADIAKIQKALEKYTVNISTSIDETQALKDMKFFAEKMQKWAKDTYNIDIPINDDDLLKAFRQMKVDADNAAKAQDRLTEAMAKGREKSEQLRQTEEKRQQLAQNNASNKALEQEYLTREKILSKIREEQTIGSLTTKFDAASASYANYEKLGVVTDKLKTDFAQLKIAQDALGTSTTDEELVANYTKFNTALATVNNTLRQTQVNMSGMAKPITDLQRNTFSNDMLKWLNSNSAAAKMVGTSVRKIISECKTCDSVRFDKLKQEFNNLKTQATLAGKAGKSFTDTIMSGMRSFSEWGISTRIVMGVVQSFKDVLSNVKALDGYLLELSKVSDLSASGLKNITNEAYKLGETVGKTGTQVIGAVTNFKRAGYDLEESFDFAEDALKMVNVSENIDSAADSAQYLVSIMKGYGDSSTEFSQKILDSVNQVSNTQAVDFDNLVDGAQNLSAVANQANTSFEQMLGLLTGGYEVLGDMSKVSNGLITIFSRLQATDFTGNGEEVETVAKLQETFSNATNGVVNIVDETTGQLRSAYDILDDLSGIWDTLDANTQSALAQSAAGVRQRNTFLSIIENWDNVEKSIDSASNAMGSADEENSKYLESLAGKTEIMASAFQKLSADVLDSNFLKVLVDSGTDLINVLDTIINMTDGILPLLTGIGGSALLSKKGLD